ncbi:MAG TPA: RpiB/LacA/LacB family sugar-phosphate isomerase [Candidatus Babeliaceae bacterium]|nr:RpiB/LacA/LacB family sugar-phosphate isomerase [Candidatus Babeliaceae bacterium]
MNCKEKIIVIGADHRGYFLKQFLIQSSQLQGCLPYRIAWIDVGTHMPERTDYPCYAVPVCCSILEDKADFGILTCGSGLGMAIAANRFRGIYAGVLWNSEVARAGKQDDNINVAILPADFIGQVEAIDIIVAWLESSFKRDSYTHRLEILDKL